MSDPNTQPEPTMEEILESIRRIISEEQVEKGGTENLEAPADDGDVPLDHGFKAGLTAELEAEKGLNADHDSDVVNPIGDLPDFVPEDTALSLGLGNLEGEANDFEEGVLELTDVIEDGVGSDIVEPLDHREVTISTVTSAPDTTVESELAADAEPAVWAPIAIEATALQNNDLETLVSDEAADRASMAFAKFVDQLQHSRGVQLGSGAQTLEELVKQLLRPMLKEWLDKNLPTLVQRLVEREITNLAGRTDKM